MKRNSIGEYVLKYSKISLSYQRSTIHIFFRGDPTLNLKGLLFILKVSQRKSHVLIDLSLSPSPPSLYR